MLHDTHDTHRSGCMIVSVFLDFYTMLTTEIANNFLTLSNAVLNFYFAKSNLIDQRLQTFKFPRAFYIAVS